jgi:hypothetical protein
MNASVNSDSAPSRVRSGLVLFAVILSGALIAAAPASAQSVSGLVAEQVTLAPVPGAVVTAFQASAGNGSLESVAVTRTDEDGYFELDLPEAGTFRIQADLDGMLSSLSDPVQVGADQVVDDVGLVVPSRLLLMAYECHAEVGDEHVTVVGLARDPNADVVLPNVRVEARWFDGSQNRVLAGESDAGGRYRICGVPADAGFVQLQGQLLGRMSAVEEVELTAPTLVFHDVDLPLATAAGTTQPGVIQERILLEAAARGLADLSGELVDQGTGTPIQQAVVRIQGTSLQALTAADGRFSFEGVRPGSYLLEIRHLGYNVESDEVDVPAGQDVFLRMRIAPQAVELAGIEVTTRSAVEEITRLTPFRRDIVYGEAMLEEEERGARAFEVLRRGSPGLQVREIHQAVGPPILCIQSNRRVQGLTGGGCDMVQVVVDGTRINAEEAGDFLRTLPASEIESIEFLPPSEATIMYGTAGNTSNGVVVVHTRGKGPYASPLRDRRP